KLDPAVGKPERAQLRRCQHREHALAGGIQHRAPLPLPRPEIVGAHNFWRAGPALTLFDTEHAERRVDARGAARYHHVVVDDVGLRIEGPRMPAVVIDAPERPRGLRAFRLDFRWVSPEEPDH